VGPDRSSELCTRCAGLDFEEISRRKIKYRRGEYIINLGNSVDELSNQSCPLCLIFASLSPNDTADDGTSRSKELCLRAFSANFSFMSLGKEGVTHLGDSVLLGILRGRNRTINKGGNDSDVMLSSLQETGYVYLAKLRQRDPIFQTRQIKHDRVDFNLVLDWWRYCQKNHVKTCVKKKGSSLQSLRVIDCRSNPLKVVQAPRDCGYVALSYVWGSTSSNEPNLDEHTESNGLFLPRLPKTISDSIEVTRRLSLQYLWVDQYCIDQSDVEDKQKQIRHMDLVYSRAEITIIAAAGQDSNYGLPGIDGICRLPKQQCVRLGDFFLASTMAHAGWLLKGSKWATRGWTYQEGLLSKRRLIFTDQQVLYECNGMHCAEALEISLDALHTKRRDRFRVNVPTGSFAIKTPGSVAEDLMDYVDEYCRKDLSYSGDVLNALQGILRLFEGCSPPLYNLYGVPFRTRAHLKKFHGSEPEHGSSNEAFLMGLMWYHAEMGERRRGFPSWSWAGWGRGRVRMTYFSADYRWEFDAAITIEDSSTSLHKLPDLADLQIFLSLLGANAPTIHLDIWTFGCSIVDIKTDESIPGPKYSWQKETGFRVKLSSDNGVDAFETLYLSARICKMGHTPSRLASGEFVGGLLAKGYCHKERDFRVLLGLVLQDHGKFFERVGYFRIFDANWKYDSWKTQDPHKKNDWALSWWCDNATLTRRTIQLR
jgi:hypothetical protein